MAGPPSHHGQAASSHVSGLSPWITACPKHVVPPVSYQGGCWGSAGCPGEPGLPQGFSITGAAPGPSSLLLLSIRGEAMGRAERSLRLASLCGFLSCLSLTNIVPGVSPAARQRCRGWQAGVGLMHPRDVAGSRCRVVPGVPCEAQCPSQGLFPSEEAGSPGVSRPTARR